MAQYSSDSFTENIKDRIASATEGMEDEWLNEKLETFITFMMRYLLEKMRKAQSLPDLEDQTHCSSCNSLSENTLKATSGFSSMEGNRPYFEKEVVKRFGD
ncbi:MAG: hypothetical protein FDX30_08530 [Chlorobium sp.]|nr:MAG: hypothetical protein FDX30_08530 [Chlorobium sp.]